MLRTFRNFALSALVGLSALAGTAAMAQAEGLYLNFGGDRGVGVHVGDHRWDDRRDRRDRWDDRRDRWEDRRSWRASCSPERAVRKAERLGLRRARVIDVDRRTIDVGGRRHGHRIVMTFARAPHCPVIG